MCIPKEEPMKKRVLSLFLALTLCLTLLPTAAFAEGKTGGEDGGTNNNAVAKVGDTEYDTLDEILEKMEPAEITLLANVEENLTVYAATTIHMDGHSITGNVDVTLTESGENLTLTNGTVVGKVTVDASKGTFTMTAPADAAAAIDGGLEVKDGSCSVSGAKIGVKDTLSFGGDELTISGTEKAVELNSAATLGGSKKLYGAAIVGGDTSTEAVFEDGTYKAGTETAKKLSTTQVGGEPEPEKPTLTINPTEANVNAGETAAFTVTYTSTDELKVYVQGSSLDEYFTFNQTDNGDGSYTVSAKIAKETPAGEYTLYVHEMGNPSVQAKATINVISTVAKDDKGNYYTTIKDAIEKALDGSTITVIAARSQITLPDGIYVENQAGITLDLNGHSLDGSPLNVGGLTALSKVRTGKLTVIDSSGGNGAVGVTVRDGGKVEFRGSVATSCLQLQVYGGDVKFYGGNIRSFELHNDVAYANFLPKGYCYYNYSGSGSDLGSIVTAADVASVVSARRYLAVAPCSHGGKNGFDNSSATCPYCNAPAVAETALNNGEGNRQQRRFADLQTAIDADRDGGAEFKLLADVTGDYTINGTQDTGLDLNGHSIKGTVTVKGTKGDFITTTLSNTKNTTTASIDKVVACDGAELAGSKYPAVIGELTLAEGATWKTILNDTALGYKVLNADGTHKWYARDDVNGSQLNNVIINRLPITSKNLAFKVNGTNVKGNKVERGTTVQLCASCNANDVTVTLSILKTGETTPITLSGNDVQYTTVGTGTTKFYVAEYAFNDVGSYTISFTATKDGYTVTSTPKKLTVTKLNLSNAEITFRGSNESTYEPYNATTTAPGFTVTYNGKTLKLGVDYTASGTASSAGVSTQTLTIKAVEGSDYTGSKTAEWRIVPHKAKVEVGDVIKAYDGTTDLPDGKISLVSAAGSAGYQAGLPLPLSKDNGFELTDAKYDSANASETEKNISFTVKLTDTNYTFEDGTTEKAFTLKGSETDKTFKINPATIDPSHNRFEQTVFNDLAKTYEINLKQFLDTILPEGGKYGDIKYGQPSVSMNSAYYTVGGANIGNGKLSLPINKAASSKQGDEIGTVAVQVETTNYQPFTLTIHVIAQDKLVPVLAEGNTVSATDITYGQALADSKLTVNGTMQDYTTGNAVNGTFAWTDDTIKPAANDSYEAEWTFTPAAGYEEYAPATGTVTVKVKPAKLTTVSVKASRMYYTGEAQIASIIASGQSVDSTPVTFTYSDKVDGNYTSGGPTFTDAGTYTVYYKAEAANHEPATGTFTVTIDPLPISLFSVSSISKTYDGSADVTLTADKLTFFSKAAKTSNIKLPDTALSFSNAQFTKQQADGSYLPSPEVGGGKALSFTMMLTSNNYVFEGKSGGTTEVSDVFATDDANRFTITKAPAPTNIQSGTLNIINGTYQTYTYDFSKLLPELSVGQYGTVSYGNQPAISLVSQSGYYYDETIVEFKNGVLTLAQFYAKDGTMTGQIGTVKVKVTTTNYEDFQLTLVLNAINKIKPTPDGKITASNITYGQALSDSSITGKMKDPNTGDEVNGTFSWKQPGDTILDASTLGHSVEWKFTPTDENTYTEATGTVTVEVGKAQQYGEISMAGYSYGGTPSTPTLTKRTGDPNAQVLYEYSAADSGLVQTWDIQNPPALNAGTYRMFARIGETNNYYEYSAKSCEFVVAKATPTYTKPTGLTAKYGQTLADVTLSDGWSWMDSSESVGSASTAAKTFKAKFTPTGTDNYNVAENIELEVTVNKADQATLTIQGEDSVAYGETLTLKTIGGTTGGKVTYSVARSKSNGDATIDENGVLTPTKVGTISVTATMAGDENYNDVTSYYFVISIRKGKPTGAPSYTKITTGGKTLKDAALTTDGSTLKPNDGKLEWVDDKGNVLPDDTKVEANKCYTWRFTPADTNYTTLTGEIELYHKSSSGGGSGSGSGSYTITVKDAKNGDVTTDRKSASAGTTVTITVKPDSGYVLDDLTVTDSKGNDLKLAGKGGGKYTFTMPSGKVTVEASFTPAKSENPFTDIPSGAYYEDAVIWAVNNGITGGTSATTFAPDGFCTRAQAVTFLWRAAGSPAPKSTVMPFTDVPAGSYYYDAVLWAIENGITKGTSDTTFSPNANCSRGQIVTFLWRSQKSPDAAAANPFTDVAANAYYTSAVLWAVEKSITGGTSATTFSPSANCTRAQIVTFIYRCMK